MRTYLLLFLALTCGNVVAQDTLPWTLSDQFDKTYTLDRQTRVLMIARSMSSARLVNSAVEHTPAGYLDARGVVFVADIEKLPSMVQAVLVPSMRSAQYRILLDRDGQVAERYAGDRDSVQWLEMEEGAVVRERRFNDLASLRQALAGLVGAASNNP
ncbi:hypothetical protein CCOS865_01341 [Pseudomonas reidholzensis]|uniref:FAD/FMN-containing dehydrogenase n=1 Tax=Pseudomonas reidholzensis TaxID=1785162 RepID=A0A383RRL9_9PSED|nr:hypothetical protein [Pseudomonas reidholzensis]SYX89101.1 hypothetical protein CCOS865_01341 [Pseudomonas reidholzensis]